MHGFSRMVYSFYPRQEDGENFHPEEFEDVDPDAILEEFFDRYTLTKAIRASGLPSITHKRDEQAA